MGMQYMDVIHQNEKLRKKNKELELKNASLMKETNMMRERQDDLLRKIDRLERNEKKRNNRNDMVELKDQNEILMEENQNLMRRLNTMNHFCNHCEQINRALKKKVQLLSLIIWIFTCLMVFILLATMMYFFS